MTASIDTSAVFARYPCESPTERYAAADRERMAQLNEICRPEPGAKAERRRKFGTGQRRPGHGSQRVLNLWFDVDVQLEMGREAIRRGVNTSAIVREAWALARPDLQKMEPRVRARRGSRR